jgi:two-component system response regulator AtoC
MTQTLSRDAATEGDANTSPPCDFTGIIGQSPAMQHVFHLIERSARVNSTVLILGESGTGKDLVAQAIHRNSPRRQGPFVAFNCAAMPATLVESELFGHEKGAFTGALERRIGRFESASNGTLFIDEIGEFEMGLQVKLLRVLENRVLSPVGSNKEISLDTRVVTATSRNIRDMMAHGTFREDLFYRLNVISIELPPLRERLDDIPLLVPHFMERVNAQNHTKATSASPAVLTALQRYHWPGNVRELLNVIERAMVMANAAQLELHDLPPLDHARPAAAASQAETRKQLGLNDILASMTLNELEQRAIDAALQRNNNNRTRAARSLGISVRTLQRKLLLRNAAEESDALEPGDSLLVHE